MAPRGVLTAARVLPLAMALAYLGTAAGDRRHPDNSAAAAAATPPQWTCERGMDAFCQCDPRLRDATPELCSVAAAQCRASFCSPVCTSMAWGVRVSVDCSAAPGWHDCPRYAAAMHAGGGAAAVEAQFKVRAMRSGGAAHCNMCHHHHHHTSPAQAHVCSRVMGCCDGEDKALQWRVDEALYRDHYPRPVLPAAGCTGAGNGEARCAACRAATRVSLTADASLCAPSAPTLAETYVVQPLSLHERVRSACCLARSPSLCYVFHTHRRHPPMCAVRVCDGRGAVCRRPAAGCV